MKLKINDVTCTECGRTCRSSCSKINPVGVICSCGLEGLFLKNFEHLPCGATVEYFLTYEKLIKEGAE